MSHQITLTSPQHAHEVFVSTWQWVKAKLQSGQKVRLAVGLDQRTPGQNDRLQASVRAIGKALGRKDHDETRLLLVELWRKETGRAPKLILSLDGQRWVDVSNSSAGLDVAEASEFIEWLQAKEAEVSA